VRHHREVGRGVGPESIHSFTSHRRSKADARRPVVLAIDANAPTDAGVRLFREYTGRLSDGMTAMLLSCITERNRDRLILAIDEDPLNRLVARLDTGTTFPARNFLERDEPVIVLLAATLEETGPAASQVEPVSKAPRLGRHSVR
jgi:hypothetical protein